MTATNHALTGAITGLVVGNPLVALPVAFLSHFVLDVIPHYGNNNVNFKSWSFRSYLLLDAMLCGALVLALGISGTPHWELAALCAFVATTPDFLWVRKFLAGNRFRPTRLEHLLSDGIQWFARPIGVFVELAWFFGAIAVLFALLG